MVEYRFFNKIYKNKNIMGREMHMTVQIDAYEIDQVILHMGSDANVLPKKTWQRIGEPNLEWQTIQMHMEIRKISFH